MAQARQRDFNEGARGAATPRQETSATTLWPRTKFGHATARDAVAGRDVRSAVPNGQRERDTAVATGKRPELISSSESSMASRNCPESIKRPRFLFTSL
jgi:hypothetical protein